MDTSTKYYELKTKIEKDLTILNQKLEKHQNSFEMNKSNWGYVGDLEYISKKISEITSFIS
jgi:hypothetical protein